MGTLRTIVKEIIGLFIDDGSLALALMVWCAGVGLARSALPQFAPVSGPTLFLGCVAILLMNVASTAKARRAQKAH